MLITLMFRLVSGVSSYGHETGVAKIQEQVVILNLKYKYLVLSGLRFPNPLATGMKVGEPD